MVIQRDQPARLRGWASPETQVRATLANHNAETFTDNAGRWSVELPPLPAGGPHQLSITIGDHHQTFTDVMIGDVWLCSGQSNMQFTVQTATDGLKEAAAANDPLIRHIKIPANPQPQPQENSIAQWQVCSPETTAQFSAVGYFFARELRRHVDVPIGLLHASNGHTPCEAWMSRESLASHVELKLIIDRWDAMLDANPGSREDFAPYREAWQQATKACSKPFSRWYDAARALRVEGKPYPPMPTPATGICNPQNPTVLFNGMIAPVTFYPIKGAIWYQGETNAIFGSAYQYRFLLSALIDDWRKRWGVGDFPFLYVQIANHDDIQCDPADDLWPEVRDSQLACLSAPNVAMAVTIDIGQTNAIHPPNKQDVGKRLALAALAKAYGQDVIHSGPIYRSFTIETNAIRVTFDHTHAGLVLRGDESFVVAGEDRKWQPAKAVIDGDTLLIGSPAVTSPVAARYAWCADPRASLFNSEGLPASPFRTDNWPGVTDKHR